MQKTLMCLRAFMVTVLMVGMTVGVAATASATAVNYYLPYTAGTTAVVTQGPGGGTSHTGNNAHAYDFDLNGGAVLASAPGTIVSKVSNRTGQTSQPDDGNVVVVRHADNTCTRYAHLAYGSITAKNIGDSVAQAEHLGNEGNTGYTLPVGGGHHLHFQRENCSWVSTPVDFVENNWTSQNTGISSAPWQWHLRNWNSDGAASTAFSFGAIAGDHPLTGDWDGNGTFTPGIVRSVNGAWQWHLRNDNSDGGAFVSFTFGVATDNPIVGDWDGNGTMTPGVTRAVNGDLQWHLKNANDGGAAYTSFNYGVSTDGPVVGDWDGNGTFTPGIVRSVNGEWHWHLRSENSSGGAYVSFGYGAVATDHPRVGDWDGDGTFTPGITRNSGGVWQWHLRNMNSGGGASLSFSFGAAGSDMPIVGDWDGNGTVTAGIVRAG